MPPGTPAPCRAARPPRRCPPACIPPSHGGGGGDARLVQPRGPAPWTSLNGQSQKKHLPGCGAAESRAASSCRQLVALRPRSSARGCSPLLSAQQACSPRGASPAQHLPTDAASCRAPVANRCRFLPRPNLGTPLAGLCPRVRFSDPFESPFVEPHVNPATPRSPPPPRVRGLATPAPRPAPLNAARPAASEPLARGSTAFAGGQAASPRPAPRAAPNLPRVCFSEPCLLSLV
jgi:hypothetical protein